MGQCRTSGELYATLYFANFKKYSKLLPNFAKIVKKITKIGGKKLATSKVWHNFKKYSKLLPNFASSEFLATYFCYFFDDFKKNIANFCSSEFLATYLLTISKNIANFVIGHPITRRFGGKTYETFVIGVIATQ